MYKVFFLILAAISVLFHCGSDSVSGRDYRQDMRNFVVGISRYAKDLRPGFIIIPQNGQEILCNGEDVNSSLNAEYISVIDGIGREDLFYGFEEDDLPTPGVEINYMLEYIEVAKNNGLEVLVTDYCWTNSRVDDSYTQNTNKGYISFAADTRELNSIPDYPPTPNNVNSGDITRLDLVKNFLYLLSPEESFITKTNYINAISATDYDLLIIDLFYGDSALNAEDISVLKKKANGGSRLVISYMSIGEAESYRYYWNMNWNQGEPYWLDAENPEWEGNFKVRYWEQEWQDLIFGNADSYVNNVIKAGFDGVYLDIIDAFEYYE